MSDSLRYSLFCLRVAADFRNFSKLLPEDALKARCLHLSDIWTEMAERASALH